LIVVYDTVYTYNVTAGVGPFNASYVGSFFDHLSSLSPGYKFNVLPYSYYSVVNNLIANNFYSTTVNPVRCQNPEHEDSSARCAGYLLSGGVVGTTPWIPSNFSEHPLIKIDHVSMIQADFDATRGEPRFDDDACEVFGSNSSLIAAKFCMTLSSPTTVQAGMFTTSPERPHRHGANVDGSQEFMHA
jgi:hypothetical protein